MVDRASPVLVLLFSGKRKSGKDYVVGKLEKMIGMENCEVLRLSGPLKRQYALEHNLDYEKLLDSSSYKEQYRSAMVAWGEAKRTEDPAFFCDLTTMSAKKPLWIVSDARRITDLEYFKCKYKTIHVRVVASEETRLKRGWTFVSGVDDAESECGLDHENHDILVDNNGDADVLTKSLEILSSIGRTHLKLVI